MPRLFFKVKEGIFNGTHHHWHHQSETEEADYRVADGGGLSIFWSVRTGPSSGGTTTGSMAAGAPIQSVSGAKTPRQSVKASVNDGAISKFVADCRLHHDDLAARAHHREHAPFRSRQNKTTNSYIIEITTQYCELAARQV